MNRPPRPADEFRNQPQRQFNGLTRNSTNPISGMNKADPQLFLTLAVMHNFIPSVRVLPSTQRGQTQHISRETETDFPDRACSCGVRRTRARVQRESCGGLTLLSIV